MSPKKYLRLFLINLAALWVAVDLIPGVSFSGGGRTLVSAALALVIVNFLIKPLVKLLLLPINLLTLGAFRWLINVFTLYLVTLIVPEFKVDGFVFPGLVYQGFVLPEVHLSNFWALAVTSFLISFLSTFLFWLRK